LQTPKTGFEEFQDTWRPRTRVVSTMLSILKFGGDTLASILDA
jgi:hypothetical protein